jgi:hypothetical protein
MMAWTPEGRASSVHFYRVHVVGLNETVALVKERIWPRLKSLDPETAEQDPPFGVDLDVLGAG